MPNSDALLVALIAGAFVQTLSCKQGGANESPRVTTQKAPAVATRIPDDLIRRASSASRDEWYAAAEQLGELARHDDAMRSVIWSLARVNSLGAQFTEIQPGDFTMGPSAMPGGKAAQWHPEQARNEHKVEITEGFFISVTEVTNAQFALLVPDHKPPPRSPHPDSPATGVTWKQAVEFCRLLSEREGARYRLPTEAEWEYACRAGSTTRFCFGDDPALLEQYAWYGKFHEDAAPVASLKANAWGLYDMHGNALEWTADWYAPDLYQERAAAGEVTRDPKGPALGSRRVLRGGDWRCWEPSALASSKRTTLPWGPAYIELFDPKFPRARDVTGFRVVRERD